MLIDHTLIISNNFKKEEEETDSAMETSAHMA
jgi:hypothetical protein